MVAVFLQAEIDSPRFGETLSQILRRDNIDERVVLCPDIYDEAENRSRINLLGEFRGYRRNTEIFHEFPDDMLWERAALDRADLERIKYIDYPYWIELAGGSRWAHDAARRIGEGVIAREEVANYRAVADRVKQGVVFPELILVGKSPRDDLVVLEGHMRLTAYLMAAPYLPPEIEGIVGYSAEIEQWGLY